MQQLFTLTEHERWQVKSAHKPFDATLQSINPCRRPTPSPPSYLVRDQRGGMTCKQDAADAAVVQLD